MEIFIKQLKSELEKPLPGREIQYKMAHKVRQMRELYSTPREDVRMAAVLAHLYPKKGEIYLTLMMRTDRGPHSGQISFPGGGVEDSDKDLIDTALRESREEVGIQPEEVKIIGRLSELYISVSNSLVHPYVGYSKKSPSYTIDPNEVKFVIEAPLNSFLDESNLRKKDISLGKHLILREVPYYKIGDHVIWGATAMMLCELLVLVQRAGMRPGLMSMDS